MKNVLRQLRNERNLTLKEVSKAIGLSLSAYSNYEQGIREPSIEIIKRICKFYQVSSDYLIGLSEDESASWINEGNLETPLPHVSKRAEQEEEEDNSPPVRIRYAARGEGNLYADTTEKKLKMLHEALLRNKINPEDDGI